MAMTTAALAAAIFDDEISASRKDANQGAAVSALVAEIEADPEIVLVRRLAGCDIVDLDEADVDILLDLSFRAVTKAAGASPIIGSAILAGFDEIHGEIAVIGDHPLRLERKRALALRMTHGVMPRPTGN
jgi:hypothetical protein